MVAISALLQLILDLCLRLCSHVSLEPQGHAYTPTDQVGHAECHAAEFAKGEDMCAGVSIMAEIAGN